MASVIFPSTAEVRREFCRRVETADDERPIVEMNDETARNMEVIWKSIDAAALTWLGGQDARVPGKPTDRQEYWGDHARSIPLAISPEVITFIQSLDGRGKTAIDLGCGKGAVTILLLQRGWKVIAVDNSGPALDFLKKYREEQGTGQLTVVQQDVTTYLPAESVDLVIAYDILPYIDPKEFRATWAKIHDTFLKKSGLLLGTLFRKVKDHIHTNLMKEQGAWLLPDRRMVRPLLQDAGYEIKECKFRDEGEEGQDPKEYAIGIRFIAEKK